jgi:hypothetical protein
MPGHRAIPPANAKFRACPLLDGERDHRKNKCDQPLNADGYNVILGVRDLVGRNARDHEEQWPAEGNRESDEGGCVSGGS